MDELDYIRRRGVVLETAVDANRILSLINRLKPIKTQHELMRVGPDRDGGYLIPDDIHGITSCFTASSDMEDPVSFEQDLLESFGIKSHLTNHSMEEVPKYFTPLSFMQRLLGPNNDSKSITLDSWMKGTIDYEYCGAYQSILRVDCHGNEYGALLSTSEEVLTRFRIIVLKLNDIDKWGHPAFFKIAEALINKILQNFNVVHLHPNNQIPIRNINGVDLPGILEITFLAIKRCKMLGYVESLPDELDRTCHPEITDIALPDIWYK